MTHTGGVWNASSQQLATSCSPGFLSSLSAAALACAADTSAGCAAILLERLLGAAGASGAGAFT